MVDRVDDVLIRRDPTSQPEWLNELSDVMDDDAEILDSRNDEHSPDRGREHHKLLWVQTSAQHRTHPEHRPKVTDE